MEGREKEISKEVELHRLGYDFRDIAEKLDKELLEVSKVLSMSYRRGEIGGRNAKKAMEYYRDMSRIDIAIRRDEEIAELVEREIKRIMGLITKEDIRKASLVEKGRVICNFIDRMRLLRGQSTDNIHTKNENISLIEKIESINRMGVVEQMEVMENGRKEEEEVSVEVASGVGGADKEGIRDEDEGRKKNDKEVL